jgi:HD superfamily phosphohydrolase YqeK
MCPPTLLNTLGEPSPQDSANLPHETADVLPACIPRNGLCISAYNLARANLPPAIFNHSLRVYIYATKLAQRQGSIYAYDNHTSYKHSLMAVACILHDIGCAARFDGPQRFEVEGADAAKAHVLSFEHLEQEAHDVWVAIACHTSPHIAEKISPLAYLVRVAVLFDFRETGRLSGQGGGSDAMEVLSEELRKEVEGEFPRLEPEKVLGDVVVEQARRQRCKAPAASWPGILLRAAEEEPEWEFVNKAF